MKRSILCILAVTLAMIASASPVMPEQAKQVAQAWAQKNSAFGVRSVASGEVVPFTNEVTTLWYQVQMTDGSCLIVSPVTELEPVIAALEDVDAAAGLPAGHPMLAMLTRDMIDRLRKLGLYRPTNVSGGPSLMGAAPSGEDAAPSDPALAAWAEQGKARWARLLPKAGPQLMTAPETGVAEIDIQIGIVDGFEKGGRFTHWDQEEVGGYPCYNYCTPHNAVCGCVATSMAAMMQFFSVTGCVAGATCPKGLIRETQDGVVGATFADADGNVVESGFKTLGGTYDWSIFSNKTDRAGYNSLTVEERELLGRVAYDCGVAVAMGWTAGESSAYVLDVAAALREVFGFKDARAVYEPTEEQYAKLIYHQCWAGAPVQLGITGSGGHSVLAVGYGTDDEGIPRVRVFTGWGGAGDGWYALPYITTASIPGGGSHKFDVVDQVVTMIGYDSDETVPVVGHMDAPGEAIEVPGASRTIFANENGYFGTRVSPGLSDRRLLCRGKEASFEIGSDAAGKDDEYWVTDAGALCAALPEEIEFILLNCSVAYTFEQAKEMALAEGKAILRISGVPGDEATTNLLSYIYALDESNEGGFTNKFVYFFTSAKASNPDLPDGNPSIGVFLPSDAEQSGRWQHVNGRLSYGYGYSTVLEQTVTNDYEVAEDEMFYTITNEAYVATWGQLGTPQYMATNLPYTIEGLLDMVPFVLDNGWDEFCRRTHGIVLTVTAEPAESGLPDPAYGVHENTYTNGQEITALAPDGLVTNDSQTVISEFGAWELTVTNTAAGGKPTVTKGSGKTATFTLASNDVATLVWELEPKFAWIDVEVDDNGYEDDGNSVSPGSDWYPYGETVSFVASPAEGFAFSQWTSQSGRQLPDYLMSFVREATLSFRVDEPLAVTAYFNAGDPQEETVSSDAQTLTVWAAEVQMDESGSLSVEGSLDDDNLPEVDVTLSPDDDSQQVAMGEEIELPAGTAAVATLAANAFTDADGVEWKCVGWVLLDEYGSVIAQGNGTITSRIVLKDAAQLLWLWVSAEEDDDPDEPLGPADPPEGPDGGSPLTIYSNADGTLTVKADIANAAKGWWYVLLTAETVSGEYVPVSAAAAEDVCAKKADDDDVAPGTLVLQSTFTPTEEKRFYKVKVQEDEP